MPNIEELVFPIRSSCITQHAPGVQTATPPGKIRSIELCIVRCRIVYTVQVKQYIYETSVHSKLTLFVSILNFHSTEQQTRTENNPTDFCGGTAPLDPKTGVPSRGQRVLLTQMITFHATIAQGKPQSRQC